MLLGACDAACCAYFDEAVDIAAAYAEAVDTPADFGCTGFGCGREG